MLQAQAMQNFISHVDNITEHQKKHIQGNQSVRTQIEQQEESKADMHQEWQQPQQEEQQGVRFEECKDAEGQKFDHKGEHGVENTGEERVKEQEKMRSNKMKMYRVNKISLNMPNPAGLDVAQENGQEEKKETGLKVQYDKFHEKYCTDLLSKDERYFVSTSTHYICLIPFLLITFNGFFVWPMYQTKFQEQNRNMYEQYVVICSLVFSVISIGAGVCCYGFSGVHDDESDAQKKVDREYIVGENAWFTASMNLCCLFTVILFIMFQATIESRFGFTWKFGMMSKKVTDVEFMGGVSMTYGKESYFMHVAKFNDSKGEEKFGCVCQSSLKNSNDYNFNKWREQEWKFYKKVDNKGEYLFPIWACSDFTYNYTKGMKRDHMFISGKAYSDNIANGNVWNVCFPKSEDEIKETPIVFEQLGSNGQAAFFFQLMLLWIVLFLVIACFPVKLLVEMNWINNKKCGALCMFPYCISPFYKHRRYCCNEQCNFTFYT